MKSFNIKVYDSSGNYITTVNENLRLSDISFTEKINSGQGELSLSVKSDFENPPSWAEFNNFIKISVVKIESGIQTELLIYTGFISRINHVRKGSQEYIDISILSLSGLLGIGLYKDGSSFDVIFSSVDPSDISTDIIDKANASIGGSWLSYGSNVDSVGVNIDYVFQKKKWLDAMNFIIKLSGADWFWFIDNSGELYFKEKPSTPTHKFNIETDVTDISIINDSEGIINSSTVEYGGSGLTVTDSDATSISNYFKRDTYEKETDIDVNGATQLAEYNVATQKDPKIKVRAVINSRYDIESIHAGDTCSFFGLSLGSTVLGSNLMIVSVNYSEDEVEIELSETFSNFGDELGKYIENQFQKKQL